MSSVNKVILIGNLTRDPEIRYTPKGTAVGDLGMAMNRVRMDDNDQRIEEVTFVDVTVWGKTAENVGKFLSKGRQVYIEGRLQMDTWDDKTTGQKRTKLKVVADNVTFLGSKDDNAGSADNAQRSHDSQHQASQRHDSNPPGRPGGPPDLPPPVDEPGAPAPAADPTDDEDDIPF